MKIIIKIICLVFIFVNYSFYVFAITDSSTVDNKLDSTVSIKSRNDSIIFFKPLTVHGKISNKKIDHFLIISKDSILFSDYTTLQDIFNEKLPVYPLNLGNYANLNSFSLFGGFPSGLSFRFNGREINDYQYPFFNFETFPVEYFENIEIFAGSDALIFSNNSSSSLINFQERIYNTRKPYTKIWFSQAAYDFLASDGVFSQNFIPNVNFTFGYRRMSVKGRFDNTWMDSWNLRGGLRWNINDKTNISLVEIFTNHGQGTNGGIDKINSDNLFDELVANPKYDQMNERAFKHDLTLTFTSLLSDNYKTDSSEFSEEILNSFDPIEFNTFKSSLFFSHSELHQKRQIEIFLNDNDSIIFTKNYSILLGLNAVIDLAISSLFHLKSGAEINYLKNEQGIYYNGLDHLNWSTFAHFLTNPFSKYFSISGGIRTGVSNTYYFLNAGSKLKFNFNNNSNILIDFSKFDRIPTPAEGFHLSKETGILFLGEINWLNELFNLSYDFFYRKTQSPIISKPIYKNNIIQDLSFSNEDDLTSFGASLSLKFSLFKNFHSNIKLIVQKFFLNGIETDIFPLLYPSIDSYYEISRGRSYVRLGFDALIIPPHRAMNFNPLRRNYILPEFLLPEEQEKSQFFFNGINIYGKARLGTVYVNISLHNILSFNYYYLKYYPMYNRNLRISLHWAFDN